MKNRNNNSKRLLSITQIGILILGLIAFSYTLGNIQLVSAAGIGPGKVIDTKGGLIGKDGFLSENFDKILDEQIEAAFEAAGIGSKEVATSTAGKGIFAKGLIKLGLNPGFANAVGSIVSGALWAAAAYAGAYLISTAFGAKPGQAKAIAAGAAFGAFALAVIPGVGWIAAGIAGLVTLLTWKDETTKTAVFTCSLWQPQPTKSDAQCEKCNDGILPCSEYQCNSLGVSCRILNRGTDDQRCVWINRNDIKPPVITPWQEALLAGYSYINQSAVSPVDKGVRIKYNSSDGCVPFYTPFTFGIQINKDSKCKADVIRQPNISAMRIPLSGERYLDEHLITLVMPNAKDLEGENIIPLLNVSGGHKLYIRCMSGNGIESNANLEFNYCVQSGPDLNPPEIMETNLDNGAYVGFGVGSVNLTLSVNKPAQCRWSTLDRSYESMENSMSCATNITQANAKRYYDCRTALTGIKDREENNFFIRCNGTYNGKANPTSYPFMLRGTEPLVIEDVGPSGTIKDSTDYVKVVLTASTSAGAQDGRGICRFSKTGRENDYNIFISDIDGAIHSHSQELRLPSGDYKYYIKCSDAGLNTDNETVSFKVETDDVEPVVVRAFHDRSYLKIITNEESTCVYTDQDAIGCTYEFGTGEPMTSTDKKEHFIDWNPVLNFYIKCKDDYENQPPRDQCSIIAKPFNL